LRLLTPWGEPVRSDQDAPSSTRSRLLPLDELDGGFGAQSKASSRRRHDLKVRTLLLQPMPQENQAALVPDVQPPAVTSTN
jgi:hypothetical protein